MLTGVPTIGYSAWGPEQGEGGGGENLNIIDYTKRLNSKLQNINFHLESSFCALSSSIVCSIGD